jgi:DNA-directed RNA polymerase specialized sigma24 family protein
MAVGIGGLQSLFPPTKRSLATKDMEQVNERVTLLRAVGFTVSEVASILGITENNVRVATHLGRKKNRRRRAAKSKRN